MTFRLLITLLFLSSCSSDYEEKIGIVTFEQFNQTQTDSVIAILQRTYGIKVVHLYDTVLPKHTFINVKSPRYRANKLILHLKQTKPDSVSYVLGLTSKDISTTKKNKEGETKKPKARYQDFGIFGLGYRPGPSCIVSTFRLKRGNKKKLIPRLQKIAIHEIGHNMGLPHCPNEECVMRDAVEKMNSIDGAKMGLCVSCAMLLRKKM